MDGQLGLDARATHQQIACFEPTGEANLTKRASQVEWLQYGIGRRNEAPQP